MLSKDTYADSMLPHPIDILGHTLVGVLFGIGVSVVVVTLGVTVSEAIHSAEFHNSRPTS